MRLILRRSMPRSRAMARWLCPARCQARTVCSTVSGPVGEGGASCTTAGVGRFARPMLMAVAVAGCWVRMRVIRSSKEPGKFSARAGQALTSAPRGPWARLAPMAAAMPAPRHQRAKGGTGSWRRLALRMSNAGRQNKPVYGKGQQPGGQASLPVGGDEFVNVPVADHGRYCGDRG